MDWLISRRVVASDASVLRACYLVAVAACFLIIIFLRSIMWIVVHYFE